MRLHPRTTQEHGRRHQRCAVGVHVAFEFLNRFDRSKMIDFGGRDHHILLDLDPTWVFLVGFEVCFVVSATNSNSPRRGLLGFFVSIAMWC